MSYLVGRLTTINTQRNSFKGREGFAIAVEHLEATFGEAIITIFVSSLLQMDVSVYLLCFLSTYITHVSRSGSANLDPRRTCGGVKAAKTKSMRAECLDFVSLVFFVCVCFVFLLLPNRLPSRALKLPQTAKPPL